ncbi:(S)-8-oxocitronellyl enol synthase CYC2-like [Telopea speciosissima]|uniref:(S)-8-oxocitronellyl enol synthase CYC2-like n=1 Tax=Telopea speciosissima TaxID=54955 RepID=UPI001CC5F1F5|nr:(S)-8-oxocitronellyl enol synthase CYC2-like [Telopea speciosissima]
MERIPKNQDPQPKETNDLNFSNKTAISDEIMKVLLPQGIKVSMIVSYDGTSDLMEHLKNFKTMMLLHGALDPIMCRAFTVTLTSSAKAWFDRLELRSMKHFTELGKIFVGNFLSSKNHKKSAVSLSAVKQRKEESPRSYLMRFNKGGDVKIAFTRVTNISHCNYYYILLNIKQIGEELARTLAARVGWKVYGIARKADELQIPSSNYQFISCDLLDPIQTIEKVSLLEDVTHVYWISWASQYPLDSPECCEQNKAMMSNALNAILPKAKALKHVSLQTGGKHYLSLTRPSNSKPILYYEDSPRVDQGHILYYILEDLLMEKLEGKVAWSVHRPGLLIGISNRTYYNFIGGLCVYASICKYLNLPFLFGGSKECWEEVYIDGADARLVAEQHIWASTNENISSTKGQAFNVTNGPSFTWKEIWPAIGIKFGVKLIEEEMFSPDLRFSEFMADKGSIWEEIVKKGGLRQTKMEDLANWPFMDILFRCSHKILLSPEKANKLGFTMMSKI